MGEDLKRFFDVIVSFVGLVCSFPFLLPVMILVWLQDFHSPIYMAPRVGRGGESFKMFKLRSMVVDADRTGVDSTSADDGRITPVGHFVRRFKLDELTQLWNVLRGDMSLVGPRPNVRRETDLYTRAEKRLLDMKPGITDFSSIVFADENDILDGSIDPDLDYARLIRPWKSRLGIFYVENSSFFNDVRLIVLTVLGVISRQSALAGVSRMLRRMGAPDELVRIAGRGHPLVPIPPPGSDEIVMSREKNPRQESV